MELSKQFNAIVINQFYLQTFARYKPTMFKKTERYPLIAEWTKHKIDHQITASM